MARVGRPMTIEHARARTNVSGVYRTRSRSRRMSRRPSNKSSPKGADSISGNQSISQSGIAGRTALSDITELEIEGYGKDEGEALESFADVFSATWQAYAEEDGRLSQDARELKRRLRGLAGAVEPV